LFRLQSYFSYYWHAKKNPTSEVEWIQDWYNLVKRDLPQEAAHVINEYRKALHRDHRAFHQDQQTTTVSKRYTLTSVDLAYGKVLYHTAQYLGAKTFLELGTSLGVSSAYLALAHPSMQGVSIDANPNAIEVATAKFRQHDLLKKVSFYADTFENALPSILANSAPIDICFVDGDHSYHATITNTQYIKPYLSEHAVIILDDIRWSEGMYKAWETLKKDDSFGVTLDLGRIGLLWKTTKIMSREHLILR